VESPGAPLFHERAPAMRYAHGTVLRKGNTMARASTKILDTGDVLPSLSMETVAHRRLTVPDHFGESWGVFLLYRAHW
jgi:hypothetical protein